MTVFSSPAAAAAAAVPDDSDDSSINDEGGEEEGKASGSDDDADASDEDEEADEDEGTEDAIFRAAREIQNRTSRSVGSDGMEDRRFRDFFGADIAIVTMVWDMLGEGGLRPEKSKPKHLLWALFFLKVYLKQSPGCSAVGGGGGAVDPKTMKKWVWRFIESIAELADHVVSRFVVSSYPL